MRQIVLIAHDIRSTHNVGSLIRTADGLGVAKIYFSGYTPYPLTENDSRLPHISKKIHAKIHKTALSAENHAPCEHVLDVIHVVDQLKTKGFRIIALEQIQNATLLQNYIPAQKVALLIGREVDGIDPSLLKFCDDIVEIPMYGQKESFNVVQASAIALYHLRFYPFK